MRKRDFVFFDGKYLKGLGAFWHNVFTVFVSNQRKKLFKMATFTFRVGNHIFFI
jgi:hypothetical protein